MHSHNPQSLSPSTRSHAMSCHHTKRTAYALHASPVGLYTVLYPSQDRTSLMSPHSCRDARAYYHAHVLSEAAQIAHSPPPALSQFPQALHQNTARHRSNRSSSPMPMPPYRLDSPLSRHTPSLLLSSMRYKPPAGLYLHSSHIPSSSSCCLLAVSQRYPGWVYQSAPHACVSQQAAALLAPSRMYSPSSHSDSRW